MIVAIVLGAGRGVRFDGPKQYSDLCGKTVMSRSINALIAHPGIDIVIPVINHDHISLFEQSVKLDSRTNPGFHKLTRYALGGDSRDASSGLGMLAAQEYKPQTVLIHDAARPFLSQALIDRLLAVGRGEGVVPFVRTHNSVRDATSGIILDRSNLMMIQTPQSFCFTSMIRARIEVSHTDHCVDDASIFQMACLPLRFVEGDNMNIKITNRHDIAMADAMLSAGLCV